LHFLRDHADAPGQIATRRIVQRHTAQTDCALLRLVQAKQQPRQGRFAAAGAPQQAERLAGGQVEGDVVQRLNV
jgi:hypothetical protein